MKKIILALLAASFVVANASALTISGGLTYGHSAATKLNDNLTLTETTEAEEKFGFNAGLTFPILGPLGLFIDAQALWPLATSVSKGEDGNSYSFTPSKQFNINALVGPYLKIQPSDTMFFRLGAGLDLYFNTKEYEVEKDTTDAESVIKVATSEKTFNFGPGVKLDASFMLIPILGINIGCDVGFLWGQSTLDYSWNSGYKLENEMPESKKNFTLLVTPSINAIIKLGN